MYTWSERPTDNIGIMLRIKSRKMYRVSTWCYSKWLQLKMTCLNSHFQLSKSLEKLSKSGMHFIEKSNDLLYCRASNTVIQQSVFNLRDAVWIIHSAFYIVSIILLFKDKDTSLMVYYVCSRDFTFERFASTR